jgi:hypothetical protein
MSFLSVRCFFDVTALEAARRPCRRLWCCCAVGLLCAGYVCSNGTGVLSADVHGCENPTEYCPMGSAVRTPVPRGFYASPTPSGLFFHATQCETGRYCAEGVARRCPAGRFGSTVGLSTDVCSGNCSAGYYCPAGSTSRTQLNCSDGPAYFCPEVKLCGASCTIVRSVAGAYIGPTPPTGK